jgi:hypothetical protein
MERLRRRMFSQAQSWLMADEDVGGYVELDDEAREAAATGLFQRSSQRSPRPPRSPQRRRVSVR